MAAAVFEGMMRLKPTLEQAIRGLSPDCIFSDVFFRWTVDLADELKIPRLSFNQSGYFGECIYRSLKIYKPHENVKSETESFMIPNLPDEITIKRCQISDHLKTETGYGELIELVEESDKRSYGLVRNTFYEIEPAYVELRKKIAGTRVYHFGPVFQFFKDEEGKGGVSDRHGCLSWLDGQTPKSVIYICFGTMVCFREAQITEIALALEETKQPFIWVVGKTGKEGLPVGFEERAKKENKGLIISAWAPQVEILQHPSTGVILTHCGWNSVLEAAVAGLPLLTWPCFAEQFYNEKLLQVILGIAVGVGATAWNLGFEMASPVLDKQPIIDAINLVTGDSVKAQTMRQNAKELAIKTRNVVKEGGSSVNNLNTLIEELKALKLGRN